MFTRKWMEALRILDVRSAQRARWLGVRREERAEQAVAEEARQRAREEAARMLRERNGFNPR